MSFRDFITNRWFRRRIARDFERYQNLQPPPNPSRRYIDKLVRQLLIERKAWHARKELSMIGIAAVPSLVAATDDPRYHETKWPEFSSVPAPLESVLELLVPHGAQHVIKVAGTLIKSASEEVRKTVALALASLGSDETIPMLATLLQDSEGYVRSYVRIGIDRAISERRATDNFRRRAYDLLLAQSDQSWGSAMNDSAETVVALDSKRAAADFASQQLLSAQNPNLHRILEACNRAKIHLPQELIGKVLDESLPRAVDERSYPHEYIVRAASESLALAAGEKARPLLESLLSHQNKEIREGAARGILRLVGIADPTSFVFEQIQTKGFQGLSHEQRVVYCTCVFDGEVCNGGIMQFFGNSSGDNVVDTLAALQELGHPAAEGALTTAIKLIGPLSREPNREMRLAAFEGRYDQLQEAFGELEKEYYCTNGLLRQKWLLYAAQHPEHFRA